MRGRMVNKGRDDTPETQVVIITHLEPPKAPRRHLLSSLHLSLASTYPCHTLI